MPMVAIRRITKAPYSNRLNLDGVSTKGGGRTVVSTGPAATALETPRANAVAEE